jgi:DNA-binding CsgD family transcriptional regulator
MGKLDDQVVTALYGAIDSEARWVELMDLLRQRLGVESVAAQLLVASRDSVVPMWGTRDSVSERHAVLHDSWANSLANPRFRRPPLARRELEIGSDQRATHFSVQERGQLRDGLARCGLGPAFWISQQIDHDRRFTMIFHRPPDDGRDLETREQNLLETLAPHFRQAIGLWVRLAKAEARASLAEQVGNAMPAAAVACDRQLRVHWINADAQRLFGANAPLRLRNGALVCATRDDQQRLLALIDGRSDRAVVALGGGPGPMLHLRAQAVPPMQGQFALARDLVMLAITRPDCPVRHDPQDLARLFGLTLTEATLAASLATGASVSEFAAARGVAEGTARLHLKRVLAKTGASRQSELVRQICQSVASQPAS